jgi:hypothetical protein
MWHHAREAQPTDKIREATVQSAQAKGRTLVDSTTPSAQATRQQVHLPLPYKLSNPYH